MGYEVAVSTNGARWRFVPGTEIHSGLNCSSEIEAINFNLSATSIKGVQFPCWWLKFQSTFLTGYKILKTSTTSLWVFLAKMQTGSNFMTGNPVEHPSFFNLILNHI